MSGFTFIELFAGIGGMSFGLEAVGGECLLAAEFDPEREGKRQFAQEAYKLLHPNTHVVGDVCELNAQDVPDHDLMVATPPCQAFSVAGKRGGFEDARGTLFFEVARLASVKKPRVLLLENVKGLVGHDKGKTLDSIVKTLNDIGYRVDFDVLNSKFFGVPQNRERIFIVAIREDLVENEPWKNIEGNTVVPKGKRRISGYDDVKTFNFDFPKNEEVTTRLRDVLESSVDEKYYLSEEKTAKLVAQLNGDSGLGKDGKLGTLVNGKNISPNIDANYAKGIGPSDVTKNRNRRPMYVEPQMLGHIDLKGHDAIKRVYSAEAISPTLTTMGGGHREPKIAEEQYDDTRNEYSWADEFRIRREEAEEIRDQLEGEIRSTEYRIRKLTPLECFRLQGFSDLSHQTLVDAGISDSQRYKMAGNAVTVNVVEAIGERLLPYLALRLALPVSSGASNPSS